MTDTETTRRAPRAREGEEIWETTTEGLVWVPIVDTRGREKQVKVGGRVGSRLRIATEDRELAEERLQDPLASAFRNGMLVRVDSRAGDHADADYDQGQEITTEALVKAFATKNGNAFHAFVDGLNELNTRRMYEMAAAVDASVAQVTYLQGRVETYRPVTEGVQPAVLEMQRRGEA